MSKLLSALIVGLFAATAAVAADHKTDAKVEAPKAAEVKKEEKKADAPKAEVKKEEKKAEAAPKAEEKKEEKKAAKADAKPAEAPKK